MSQHHHINHELNPHHPTISSPDLPIPSELPPPHPPSGKFGSPAMAKSSGILMHLLAVSLVMAVAAAQCPSNDLTSCLPAAEADVQPTEECCTNLAAYANTATPEACLCEAATSSAFLSDPNVNPVYALQIPQKCSLSFPAGTTCYGFVIPGGQ